MRTLLFAVCMLLLVGCNHRGNHRAKPLDPVVHLPSPRMLAARDLIINPGAMVPVHMCSQDTMDIIGIMNGEVVLPNERLAGLFLHYNKMSEIWVVIEQAGRPTYYEMGVLSHELDHLADCVFHGNHWAALAAIDNGSFGWDTHGLGKTALKNQGFIK